jgi:hypothetical protein
MPKFVGPLVPFRRDLSLSLAAAAEHSGLSASTMRSWCLRYHIGRKVGHDWAVDAVALTLLLDDRHAALEAYLHGDRTNPEILEAFTRNGISPVPPTPTRQRARRGGPSYATA